MMATAAAHATVDLSKLTGTFHVDSVPLYNIINAGWFVINNFENAFDFCVQLKLLNNVRSCPSCRRNLKLSAERRPDHRMPVVFHCTNNSCRKGYISVREGSFLINPNYHLNRYCCL